MSNKKNTEIISVKTLLSKKNLIIPNYQRPYKWSFNSVITLLNDIEKAYYDKGQNNKPIKYRIGTIILYKNKQNKYEIVDGQQRIITLILIKIIIDNNFRSTLLEEKFSNKETITKIKENISVINNWVKNKKNSKTIINYAIRNILEVLVVYVESLDEAFQLFDSQNSRGKELNPHDLLKAFHLREAVENYSNSNNKKLMKIIASKVKSWENRNSEEINNLFSYYLYPILNWSSHKNYQPFTIHEINNYKGVTIDLCKENYNYTNINKNHYEIGHPFYSGIPFFEMVDIYFKKIEEINECMKKNHRLIYELLSIYLNDEIGIEIQKTNNELINQIKENDNTIGMKYIIRLYYCSLLYYYDRFNRLDPIIVKKLLMWALSLRFDLEMVNLSSINKYAQGINSDSKYTNEIPMFIIIKNSIYHSDLYNLDIKIKENITKEHRWYRIYEILKLINKEGDNNENK
ncbi:MAG: DUF262 domain-containing protein [Bacilli bacterium]|nr:DUF262 domain-containing protein [Bacilli bacterium]